MNPNSYLQKSGHTNNDRLVILHTDDIGMCQASVQAFKDPWAFATISAAATMVVGITHFIFHPSLDTPELRAIAPDWPARVANYNAFMSGELEKIP
jgi:hypothetical protein